MNERLESVVADVRSALSRLTEEEEAVARRLVAAIDRASRHVGESPGGGPTDEALAKVPAHLAWFSRCLPLCIEEGSLLVLAAEPMDSEALRRLEAEVGPVRAFGAPVEVVYEGLWQTYGGSQKGRKEPSRQPEPVERSSPQRQAPEANDPATMDVDEAPPEPDSQPEPEIELVVAEAMVEGEAAADAEVAEPAKTPFLLEEPVAEAAPTVSTQPEPPAPAAIPDPSEPADIRAPRAQNLDLLAEFESVSQPVPLTAAPSQPSKSAEVSAESVATPSDDGDVHSQLERLNALLHDEGSPVDPSAAALVPGSLALECLCVPVAIEDDEVVCVIADPPDLAAAERVAEAAGRALRLRPSSKELVLEVHAKAYGNLEAQVPEADTGQRETGLIAKLKGKLRKAA